MSIKETKDGLAATVQKLEELEAAARKLQNQNLADVAMPAKGRVQQLVNHPDLHLIGAEEKGEPLPFDPNAGVKGDAYRSVGDLNQVANTELKEDGTLRQAPVR